MLERGWEQRSEYFRHKDLELNKGPLILVLVSWTPSGNLPTGQLGCCLQTSGLWTPQSSDNLTPTLTLFPCTSPTNGKCEPFQMTLQDWGRPFGSSLAQNQLCLTHRIWDSGIRTLTWRQISANMALTYLFRCPSHHTPQGPFCHSLTCLPPS